MFGIDKIRLHTREFTLLNGFNLVEVGKAKHGYDLPVLKILSDGTEVRANHLYAHRDDVTQAQYKIDDRGLWVEFNPSKHYHSYHLSGSDKISTSIANIEKEMRGLGINAAGLSSATVSRLDLAAQETMIEPFMAYSQVFNTLKIPRATKKDYGTTYTVGNRSHQACFYDKGLHHLTIHKIPIKESNYMRCEARFLQAKAVQKITGIKKLWELSDASENDLRTNYSKYIGKVFSKPSANQLAFSFKEDIELINHLKNQGRSWFMKWLACCGAWDLHRRYDGWDKIENLLRDQVGIDRNHAWRLKRQFDDMLSLSSNRESIYLQLLDELKVKFAA